MKSRDIIEKFKKGNADPRVTLDILVNMNDQLQDVGKDLTSVAEALSSYQDTLMHLTDAVGVAFDQVKALQLRTQKGDH